MGLDAGKSFIYAQAHVVYAQAHRFYDEAHEPRIVLNSCKPCIFIRFQQKLRLNVRPMVMDWIIGYGKYPYEMVAVGLGMCLIIKKCPKHGFDRKCVARSEQRVYNRKCTLVWKLSVDEQAG